MPKDMTQEERLLFNEMKKLVKLANQRILSLEKTTGIKESFASKQLIDYLSSTPISSITKSGRVALKQDSTLMQKKATIKAIKEFIDKKESKVKGIKTYVQKYSQIAR